MLSLPASLRRFDEELKECLPRYKKLKFKQSSGYEGMERDLIIRDHCLTNDSLSLKGCLYSRHQEYWHVA